MTLLAPYALLGMTCGVFIAAAHWTKDRRWLPTLIAAHRAGIAAYLAAFHARLVEPIHEKMLRGEYR